MKKLFFLIVPMFLFGSGVLFDYNQWAKDFKVLVELNNGIGASIKGEDKNKNFVRDDVEKYINQKYSDDEFQKVMFLEAAKKIQQIITLPKDAPLSTHKKLDNELLQIYTCRDFILFKYRKDELDIEKEVKQKQEFKSKVLNTNQRINAYIRHKRLLPFSYKLPTDDELAKQKNDCEKLYFQVTSKEKLTKK